MKKSTRKKTPKTSSAAKGTSSGATLLLSGAHASQGPGIAMAIAEQLRTNVVRVDLSSVVSKHAGETEKQLKNAFDAAERSGAVLLFDDADALFGKRTKVGDAHDRYADSPSASLMKRLESHRGMAIFTAKLERELDPAFVRRFAAIEPPRVAKTKPAKKAKKAVKALKSNLDQAFTRRSTASGARRTTKKAAAKTSTRRAKPAR